MPGAVPLGLGISWLPSGNRACRRFEAGQGAARAANRASIAATASVVVTASWAR